MKTPSTRLPLVAMVVLLGLLVGCTKAAREKRLVAQGDRDFAAGKYESAEIAYRNALQVYGPNPALILGKVGEVYYYQGRWGGAMSYLGSSLRLRRQAKQEDLHGQLRFAQSLFFNGNHDLAFTNAMAVLQKQNNNGEALMVLVDCTYTRKRAQEVSAAMNSLPETFKNGAAFKAAHGRLLFRLEKPVEAEAELKEALRLDPKSAHAYFGMASIHRRQGSPEVAAKEVQTAYQLFPERSGYRVSCLQALLELGSKGPARELAVELTRVAPDFLPPYFLLAALTRSDGKLDDAMVFAKTALSRDPENPNTSFLVGEIYLLKEDATNALVNLQRSAMLSGEYTTAPLYYKIGIAQLLTGDPIKATATLEKALTLNGETNQVYAEPLLALCKIKSQGSDPSRELPPLIPKLERLVKEKPDVLGGHIFLADSYLMQKNPARALEITTNAIPRFPANSELQYRAGMLSKALGDRKAARQWYEKSLGTEPGNLLSLAELVSLDQADRKTDDANQLLASAIKDQPNSAPLQFLLASFELFQATDTNSAKSGASPKLLDTPEANAHLDKAVSAYRKAIELDPNYDQACMALSQLYYSRGQQKEALRTLDPLLAKTNQFGAHYLAAGIHQELDENAQAAEAYEKCLQQNPKQVAVLNNLAFLYSEKLNKPDRALELAQQARDLAPKHPSIADTLGWILYLRGDYPRALALIQESCADEDMRGKPTIQYHLGAAQYMMGNEDAARKSLGDALKGDPKAPWNNDAERKLANLKLDGNSKEAKMASDLEKALADAPTDPVLLSRWGVILQGRGDNAGALKAFESALTANRQNPKVLLGLARLKAGPLNDPSGAMELVQKARSVSPQDPEITLLMGRLAYRTGNQRLAVSSLEESARAFPDDPQVQYDLGIALYSVGRPQEALELVNKVAASAAAGALPQRAKSFSALATPLETGGGTIGSVDLARQTLAQETNHLPALMVTAADRQQAQDSKGAAAIYEQVLKSYPLFAPAARQLGLLYFSPLDEPTKANDLLTRARERYPSDPQINRALGILSSRRGDSKRALQLLADLSQKDPNDGELLFYIGKAQANLKEDSEAKKSLQGALKLKLPGALEIEAKKLLDSLK